MIKDDEPFMLKDRSGEEIAGYDKGFEGRQGGAQDDYTKSQAWQIGWAESQE